MTKDKTTEIQERLTRSRDSEWFVMRRCLALLGRLLRGPASRQELIQVVRDATGADTYAPNQETKRISAFEQDINRRLREQFDAVVRYNRRTGMYELDGLEQLPGFDIPDEALSALAFLEDTFAPGTPHHEQIKALYNHLHACLPEQRRQTLARLRVASKVDLRRLDAGSISPIAEKKVEQAVLKRRLLQFYYRSPLYEDGVPRRHTVEPYELTFDPRRGHQYLYAFCREVDGHAAGLYIYYRLDRILPERIELLETKLAPTAPRAKRYQLIYRLSPQVARLGEVTQHFEEMQVTEEADGAALVHAETDNLFFAVRTLLHYGQHCQVLGGPEAQREMREIVQGMVKLYEKL